MAFANLLAAADEAALQHLGDLVTYTTEAGASVSVRGIFDAAYVLQDAGQAGLSSCGPAVFLTLADLPSDPSDEEPTVEVAGVEYRTREVRPDGTGGVVLLLHKV